ncbi:MAG: tRNA (adenosine(37)-N6)-threonylcarbamoyltransferase complex transferase subunit TsaD [Clostridiales bacterium]|jgi:N6-L-threonylcarbamoyladenine synthase|nr:tRNA (adenosine(37)-N6)-threonylcarbamoyltransferase complex transferase subunit TsaD [Clostridiales bacterium]
MTILAIETSCDETAAAVVRNGTEILSDVVASQIDIHERFGGVVPEIASRNHTAALPKVVEQALSQSRMKWKDIDIIAVTYGAGLLGALLTGVAYAKGLSYALNKPLMAVSHVRGHIAANYTAHKNLGFPYICVLASGGHSAVLKVADYDDIEALGGTSDDAAGEAFDKVARMLGLSYPGGPAIQKLAKEGTPNIVFTKRAQSRKDYDFSFSGLKTAVVNYIANAKGDINKSDVAASFQESVVFRLTDSAVRAARDFDIKRLALCGGVGANLRLREKLEEECKKYGIETYFLPLGLCTDNAVMIAAEAYFMVQKGKAFAGPDLDASANLPF